MRKVFPSVSYFFSQFLRAGILCREKVVQVRDRRSRICDLFETLFLLERTGKKVTNNWKNFEHDTNLDNYSNRMFFLIFLELHLLDLCVDMVESFPNSFLIEVCGKFSSHVRKNIFPHM